MLLRWGYSDVFTAWQFHMTLTRRLTPEEARIYRPAAEAYFSSVISSPRQVMEIALFVEPHNGDAFILAERLKLGG